MPLTGFLCAALIVYRVLLLDRQLPGAAVDEPAGAALAEPEEDEKTASQKGLAPLPLTASEREELETLRKRVKELERGVLFHRCVARTQGEGGGAGLEVWAGGGVRECAGACALSTHNQPLPAAPAPPPAPNPSSAESVPISALPGLAFS